MHVSEAMEILCERRRFHAIVFLLLALNFMFIPIHIFVDLFLSYEPKHYCAIPPDGNKYAWIPYNYQTHEFYQCAIYDPPLSKELAVAEKHKILKDADHHETKSWDWKSLKFKTKKHDYNHGHHEHDEDDDEHGDHVGYDATKKNKTITEDRHGLRRRRELAKPATADDPNIESSTQQHRFVDEDGQLVQDPTTAYDVEDHTEHAPVAKPKYSAGGGDSKGSVGDDVVSDGAGSSAGKEDHHEDEGSALKPMEDVPESTTRPLLEEHSDDGNHEKDEEDEEEVEEDMEEGMQSDQPREDVIVSRWRNLNWIGGGGDSPKDLPHPFESASREHEHDPDDDDSSDKEMPNPKSRSGEHGDTKPGSGDSHGTDLSDSDGSARKSSDADFKVSASKDRSYGVGASSKYGDSSHRYVIRECEDGLHYETNVGTTLATEYGLSCKKDVSVITNTVLGTAMVAGAIIFAPFVDKYGRKTLFMMVCCQNVLISLGIAFVGDIRSYWVLRFLSRFYIEGVEIAILVLAVEMAPTKTRPIAPLILYVAYAIGQVLLSLQAMWFQSWWKLQLAISVETMLLIPFSWFLVPESIQWLVSMRRHHDAEKLIRLGCRLNGTILASDFALDRDHVDDDGHGHDHEDEATDNGHHHGSQPRKSAVERLRSTQLNLKNRPGTGEYLQHEFHAHIGDWRKVYDLMKNRQLRRHFFIVSYMWAIVGFLYYGLTASTMVMKGNVYLNYCLSGLVMIPASVSIFILRRFGRKKPIFYFLIGAGIFIILSVICPPKLPNGLDLYAVYLATKLMAKYCVVSCLISIRLLIIELFPTPVRGTLIGLTAFIGLLGSALGYYFLELIAFSKWVGVVVGALALLAAALSRLLPETSHRPLPDTINDMMAACREMFLNLLVAMPNVPRPEEPVTPVQARPKRNMSALSAFSAVLSWKSKSKGPSNPVRSMSDEDFKRAPHMPLSSMTSAPLPRSQGDDGQSPTGGAAAMRALVARAKEANATQQSPAASPRQTLRQKLARALSTKRAADGGGQRLDVPAEMAHRPRRCSSTPSLSATDKKKLGIDNPQYEHDGGESGHGSVPKVTFDLVRADSRGLAENGLEDPNCDEKDQGKHNDSGAAGKPESNGTPSDKPLEEVGQNSELPQPPKVNGDVSPTEIEQSPSPPVTGSPSPSPRVNGAGPPVKGAASSPSKARPPQTSVSSPDTSIDIVDDNEPECTTQF